MLPWLVPEFDNHEQVSSFYDAATGLKAIIAVHSTKLGPALGGTRFWPYAKDELALNDVLRLSRAMSYKCALIGAPYGGGKAVIIGDPVTMKNRALLRCYGAFLNRMGPVFATGEDVGMSVEDCEEIRLVSPYVAGTKSRGAGDPSVHTAIGVLHGLRALMRRRFDHEDFSKVTVAVQGLGSVGFKLCSLLHDAGAKLLVSDIRAETVTAAFDRFGATIVEPDRIHAAEADIFSPCALGGILNGSTVGEIQARAIGGAANNQLASPDVGFALMSRGILHAPDYVINAGGVIGGLGEMANVPGRSEVLLRPLSERLAAIYDRLHGIFERSSAEGLPPEIVAHRMARDLIGSP